MVEVWCIQETKRNINCSLRKEKVYIKVGTIVLENLISTKFYENDDSHENHFQIRWLN